MNINFNNISVNFGKTLKAKACVLNDKGLSVPCHIYELDPKKDCDYFENLSQKESWQKAEYIDFLDEEIPYIIDTPEENLYAIETQNGECLGVSTVMYKPHELILNILETAPAFVNDGRHKSTPYRYVGETLIAFLAKMAASSNKEYIQTEPADSAKEFYMKHCHFKPDKDSEDYNVFLRNKSFNRLIKQNEHHTKSKLEVIG